MLAVGTVRHHAGEASAPVVWRCSLCFWSELVTATDSQTAASCHFAAGHTDNKQAILELYIIRANERVVDLL